MIFTSSAIKKYSTPLHKFTWILLFLFLAGVAAIRAPGVDRDYFNYLSWFNLINFNFNDALAEKKDLGFVFLYKLISFITVEPWLFFFVISILALFFKTKFAITMFDDRFVGVLFLLIIARFYLLHEFTQIRAGVAIALSSYAVAINLKKEIKKSYIYFLLAILMHLSAILIPIVLISYKLIPVVRKRYFLIALPLFGFLSAGISMIILKNIDMQRLLVYADSNQIEGVSLLSFYYLVRFIIFYLIVINFYSYLKDKHKVTLYFSAVSLFSNAAFSWSSVISLRIVELLGMFDLAMFLIPMLFIKQNSVWIYKSFVVVLAFVLFSSTVKIMNPYVIF